MSVFTLGEFTAVVYALLFAWWATSIQGRSWDDASSHGWTSWSFLWLGAICSCLAWTSAFAASILGGVGVLNWAFHNITPQEMKMAWRILETGTAVAVLSPLLGVVFSATADAISRPPSRASASSGWWWYGSWGGHTSSGSSDTPSPGSSAATTPSLSGVAGDGVGSAAATTASSSGGSSATTLALAGVSGDAAASSSATAAPLAGGAGDGLTSAVSGSSGGGSGGSFDLGDAWPVAVAIFVAALVLLALSLGIFVNVKLVKYYARKKVEIPAVVRGAYGR
jgi:hypothetical protein